MSKLQPFSSTINSGSKAANSFAAAAPSPAPSDAPAPLQRFSETISFSSIDSELSEEEFQEAGTQEGEKLLEEFKKNFVDSIEMRKSVSERKKAQSNLEKLFKNLNLPEKIRKVIPDVKKTFELITAKTGEERANLPAVQATGRVIKKMGWRAPLYKPEEIGELSHAFLEKLAWKQGQEITKFLKTLPVKLKDFKTLSGRIQKEIREQRDEWITEDTHNLFDPKNILAKSKDFDSKEYQNALHKFIKSRDAFFHREYENVMPRKYWKTFQE